MIRTFSTSEVNEHTNFFFKHFPYYYKENDTYKDSNGKGLLERFLEIFCNEVDEEVSPYLDNLGYLMDIENMDLLPHIEEDKKGFENLIADIWGI